MSTPRAHARRREHTPTDHRPTSQARIYSLGAAGNLVFERELRIGLATGWIGW